MDQEFINRLHDTTERHSEEIAKLRKSDVRTRETVALTGGSINFFRINAKT